MSQEEKKIRYQKTLMHSTRFGFANVKEVETRLIEM